LTIRALGTSMDVPLFGARSRLKKTGENTPRGRFSPSTISLKPQQKQSIPSFLG